MTTSDTTLPWVESPHAYRFTRSEYYKMGDIGFFANKRVELIDGEIIEMAPQKDFHAAGILLAQQHIQRALPHLLVRTQMPLDLGQYSDPEPDVSVVAGKIRDYVGTGHPRTAVLVVEISDTTLRFDRGKKASLYARAGIADYWIVNLIENCVEVHRDPGESPGVALGWKYQSVMTLRPPQTVSPLAGPETQIAVADLLP